MDVLGNALILVSIYIGTAIWVFLVGTGLYLFNRLGDSKGTHYDFIKKGSFHVIDVKQLYEWIRNKAGLSVNQQLACNIVVSFFIQNCEVFHK